MDITYRIASQKDIKEIDSLIQSAIVSMNEQNIKQWDEEYPSEEILSDDISKAQLYVGCVEDRIAVLYVLNEEYDEDYNTAHWRYEDKPYIILHRLCVHPDFQNQRIARKTMLQIENQVRSMGKEAIRLDAFSENSYALRLYDSLGYTRVGQADWRMGRFYLMEKYL